MRSMKTHSDTMSGAPTVETAITENADGTLTFTVTQNTSVGAFLGDLRGLFFDVADESLIGSLSVGSNGLVTEVQQGDDSVKDLGKGAGMHGKLGADGGYDLGIEIGTEGIAKDDVQTFTFTLDSSLRDLTLEDFSGVDFGVRLTSVGQDLDGNGTIDTSREGSSKVGGVICEPPPSEDTFVPVDESTPAIDEALVSSIDTSIIDTTYVDGYYDSGLLGL